MKLYVYNVDKSDSINGLSVCKSVYKVIHNSLQGYTQLIHNKYIRILLIIKHN